jgi:hypothetical protein
MDGVRGVRPMRFVFIFLAAMTVSCWPATALADDVKNSVVGEAQAFLDEVRDGRLPVTAEVILNAGGAQRHLSKAEASELLTSCREDILRWTQIRNRDGTADLHENTVETRFACSDGLARYTGSAGVVLSRDDKIIRLIFQVDGYAASFLKKAK